MQILQHKFFGENKPYLVILHGLFGEMDNWQSIAKILSDQFCVLTVDQRNHGKSPHFKVHNYEAMAADLDYLLDELNIEKCFLLGHSMGGKTAMRYACEHPERVQKLIVADIGPKHYPPHHQSILKTLHAVDFSVDKSRSAVADKMKSIINSEAIVQFLMKGIMRDAQKNLCWKFNLDVLTEEIENIGDALNPNFNYKGDTLFLAGENSDYIVKGDEILIKQIFPNNKIQVVKNAGHWMHAENPDDFVQFVREFLS